MYARTAKAESLTMPLTPPKSHDVTQKQMVSQCSDRFPFAAVADKGQRSRYAANAPKVSRCHGKADGLTMF